MAKFYVTIGLLALGICFANGKIIKHNYFNTVKGELTFGSFIMNASESVFSSKLNDVHDIQ